MALSFSDVRIDEGEGWAGPFRCMTFSNEHGTMISVHAYATSLDTLDVAISDAEGELATVSTDEIALFREMIDDQLRWLKEQEGGGSGDVQ